MKITTAHFDTLTGWKFLVHCSCGLICVPNKRLDLWLCTNRNCDEVVANAQLLAAFFATEIPESTAKLLCVATPRAEAIEIPWK